MDIDINTENIIEARIREAARLGFTQCVLPRSSLKSITNVPDNIELIPVKNIKEAVDIVR